MSSEQEQEPALVEDDPAPAIERKQFFTVEWSFEIAAANAEEAASLAIDAMAYQLSCGTMSPLDVYSDDRKWERVNLQLPVGSRSGEPFD